MSVLEIEEVQSFAESASLSQVAEGAAQWMKIRVRREGKTVVELTQGASAIERLETMLDDSLKQRIRASGVDLAELAASTRERGYRSGPLFAMNDGAKEVAVWLE